MILSSMSYKEMYDAIVADVQKIQIRIDKVLPKVVRQFKKSRSFPVWYVDEYTIPATNNQHIIFYYSANISEAEKPHYQSFTIVFADRQRYVIKGMTLGYQHTPNSEVIPLPQIHAYTSHFLQRYNERFLHNDKLSANEIAGFYLLRNPLPIPIMLNEDINIKYKEYGIHNNQGMRVRDGFCFTNTAIDGRESEDGIREHDRVDAIAVIYTTFLNEGDMSGEQRIAIKKEHIETFKRCMNSVMEGGEYNIGRYDGTGKV